MVDQLDFSYNSRATICYTTNLPPSVISTLRLAYLTYGSNCLYPTRKLFMSDRRLPSLLAYLPRNGSAKWNTLVYIFRDRPSGHDAKSCRKALCRRVAIGHAIYERRIVSRESLRTGIHSRVEQFTNDKIRKYPHDSSAVTASPWVFYESDDQTWARALSADISCLYAKGLI